jgi:hypothetical protein
VAARFYNSAIHQKTGEPGGDGMEALQLTSKTDDAMLASMNNECVSL